MTEPLKGVPPAISRAIEFGCRYRRPSNTPADSRSLVRPAFEAVLSAVDTWPAPGRDDLIYAAGRGLDAWADGARSEWARGEAMLDALLGSPSWPLVRALEVSLPDLDAAARFAERTELTRLRCLGIDVDEPLDAATVRRLLGSPHLDGLRSLRLGGHWLRDPAAEALAREPLLGRLKSLGLPGSVAHVLDSARLDRLIRLQIDGGSLEEARALSRRFPPSLRCLEFNDLCDDGGLEWLAASRALGAVTDLTLTGSEDGPETAEALAGNPWLGRLERLDLSGCSCGWIGTEGFYALGRAHFLEGLTALELDLTPVGAAGWELLARWPLGRLRRLSLARTEGGDAGAAALAASPHLTRLEELDLGYNGLGPVGLAALAGAPWLEGVRALDLEMNPVQDPGPLVSSPTAASLEFLNPGELHRLGVMAVAASPHLGRLEYLCVGCHGLDPACVAALGRSAAGASLTGLLLAYDFGDACARELVDSPGFGRLRGLTTMGDLTADGVAALAGSPLLAGLWRLGFGIQPLGEEAAGHLAASPHLRTLIRLDLFGCRIGPAGSALLVRSPVARTLREVRVGEDELPAWIAEPGLLPVLRARSSWLGEQFDRS